MRVYFQAAYDNCAARRWTVPLPRIQNDTGVIVGATSVAALLTSTSFDGSRAATEGHPYKSFDDAQGSIGVIAEVDPNHAPAAFREGVEVAECLCLLENAERVRLTWNREICLIIRDNLEEHACVRTTLVKLSGRMQKPRSITNCHRTPRRMA